MRGGVCVNVERVERAKIRFKATMLKKFFCIYSGFRKKKFWRYSAKRKI